MDDREKLIELMKEWGNKNTDSFPFESVADHLIANGAVIQKEAEWVKVGYKWMCSNCKSKINIDGTPTENNLFYCPDCGAKMKEA